MKLSILICTIPSRYAMLKKLHSILYPQLSFEVEVLLDDRRNITVGQKRNNLLSAAHGEYVCHVDDDDRIAHNYVQLIMQGIETNVDCCSLVGEITVNGMHPKKFIHSLDYSGWYEKNNVYYRSINHLNCIKSSIAKHIGFTEKNHGEDYDFSIKLRESGLLKTEHKIDQVIYYYDYRTDK